MLLFKLLSFWGVLLTQVCYCLRLYSNWIDSRNFHFLNKRKSTTRFQSLTWLLFYKLGSLGSFLSSMVVVKVMVVESFILCYLFIFSKMALLNPCMKFKKTFWPKDFFWGIMKVPYTKNIHNLLQGPENPGFRSVKVQLKLFSKRTHGISNFFFI